MDLQSWDMTELGNGVSIGNGRPIAIRLAAETARSAMVARSER